MRIYIDAVRSAAGFILVSRTFEIAVGVGNLDRPGSQADRSPTLVGVFHTKVIVIGHDLRALFDGHAEGYGIVVWQDAVAIECADEVGVAAEIGRSGDLRCSGSRRGDAHGKLGL